MLKKEFAVVKRDSETNALDIIARIKEKLLFDTRGEIITKRQ